jgi:adenylylsulfate kinase-like enzyme
MRTACPIGSSRTATGKDDQESQGVTQTHPATPSSGAAILLTGLSGAGKTTLASALVQQLKERGIHNTVLIDGEDLRARLSRKYGHSLEEREAVWREIVDLARREMDQNRIVVIASIAHRVSMRVDARIRLQPFFEVHLDTPVDACASRDVKGHYRRAYAAEYDCFIGVTHPYEPSGSPELRIDTSAVPQGQAESLLLEKALGFLSSPQDQVRPQSRSLKIVRRLEDYLIDSLADLPIHFKSPYQRRQDLLKLAPKSKSVVKMERASCSQMALLYGGMDAYISTKGKFSGMSPTDFLRVSGLFGRNLVWIRDPYGENFFKGVSESLNSAEAVAEWTRAYIRSLPHVQQTYGIGYSSGCYGALMFGHMCRLDTVWAFSPRGCRAESGKQDREWLRDLLKNHNGVTQYRIWYSWKNKRDKAFAELLADCPGVTLHPSREGGSRHSLIRYLAENNALRSVLPAFAPAARPRKPASDVEVVAERPLELLSVS